MKLFGCSWERMSVSGSGIRKTSRKHWPLRQTFKNEISTGKDKESVASGLHRVKHTQKWEAPILGNPSWDHGSSCPFSSSGRSCSELGIMDCGRVGVKENSEITCSTFLLSG